MANDSKNTEVKKLKTSKIFILVSVIMPIIAILGYWFAYRQVSLLEEGVLDICAIQQDAYVNLVIDQINLNKNRSNDEIISDILSTLDASTTKYWTLSTDQTMLFVKDVFETNKYKGFTTSSYYVSDSAYEFFDTLPLNKVKHDDIVIDDQQYIVSGAVFQYNGQEYKICLLTNRAVLLDNNKFLEAKSELWIMLYSVLGFFAIIPMLMGIKLHKMYIKSQQEAMYIKEMNDNLIQMNDRLSNKDLHDTRSNLWKENMFDQFVERIKAKKIDEVVFFSIGCPTLEIRDKFLSLASYALDNRVLRFESGETDLILVFIGINPDTAHLSVMQILSPRETCIKKMKVGGVNSELSIQAAANEVKQSNNQKATNMHHIK